MNQEYEEHLRKLDEDQRKEDLAILQAASTFFVGLCIARAAGKLYDGGREIAENESLPMMALDMAKKALQEIRR